MVSTVALVMCHAWVCHFMMSMGWISKKHVAPYWPIAGTITGIAALCWIPIGAFLVSGDSITPAGIIGSIELNIMFVAPSVLLGVVLVWFHLRPSSSH